MRKRHYPALIGLLISLFISACSDQPESAEDQIRNVLAQMETAAESKALSELKDFIADNYQDKQGNDKKNISRILTLYFFRNQSIHLLTRIHSITIIPPDNAEQAKISLSVAMAGTPFPEDLSNFRADLMRFEIIMVNQGGTDWQVQYADWQRADIQDFL